VNHEVTKGTKKEQITKLGYETQKAMKTNQTQRLFTIVELPLAGRWFLRLVADNHWAVGISLTAGARVDDAIAPIVFRVRTEGPPSDLSFDMMGVPVASPRAAELLRRFAPGDVQLIPALIPGFDGFMVVNIVNLVDCSTYKTPLPLEIDRPDRIGDHQIMRLDKMPNRILFSERLANAFLEEGLVTGEFYECDVTPRNDSSSP
jgi:hypothetical protein